LSGGALEIFLEPTLPAPLVAVIGSTPITDALVMMAGPLGFVGRQHEPGAVPQGATAVVIGTHGHGEGESIRAALDAGVGFVGLVASPKRGKGVLASIELTDEERAKVHTPVGLDIGARTPEEIALSILAELVRAVRREGLTAPAGEPADVPQQVIDPVCGMTVVVGPETPSYRDADGDHWFCAIGCRDSYAAAHPA
jgi:xanthine dehydrogenase accessory factor